MFNILSDVGASCWNNHCWLTNIPHPIRPEDQRADIPENISKPRSKIETSNGGQSIKKDLDSR